MVTLFAGAVGALSHLETVVFFFGGAGVLRRSFVLPWALAIDREVQTNSSIAITNTKIYQTWITVRGTDRFTYKMRPGLGYAGCYFASAAFRMLCQFYLRDLWLFRV
jgi:hypothetical protein